MSRKSSKVKGDAQNVPTEINLNERDTEKVRQYLIEQKGWKPLKWTVPDLPWKKEKIELGTLNVTTESAYFAFVDFQTLKYTPS